MSDVHARLSASGAHRWINCPPSVALEENFPEKTSAYAEEGTQAHAIAEQKLTNKLVLKNRKKTKCEDKDMDQYTDEYVNYCVEVFNGCKKYCKDPTICVEERLDFSDYVPGGFGTGDCCIIADNTLHVIDLKYGKGVPVSAENNPQLRLYGLGAIKAYEMMYDFDTVVLHIMQPRLDNISIEENKVEDLKRWAEEVVVPAAKLASVGEGDFHSGNHCQFCKAKAVCKARADYYLALDRFDNIDPRVLHDEDLQEVLVKADSLKKWADDVKEYALEQILEGNEIPGYKAVEGRSIRVITDPNKVSEVLLQKGFAETMIYKPKELVTLTALEKLVGKKDFSELCSAYIDKPAGKPTLAPESDKRPAINKVSAEEDFAEELMKHPS